MLFIYFIASGVTADSTIVTAVGLDSSNTVVAFGAASDSTIVSTIILDELAPVRTDP
jgi:hypothetical protein